MKTLPLLQAEFNNKAARAEERYVELRELVGKALQRSMALKAALANYELKVEQAVAELDAELKVIEDNFK